MRHMRWLHLVSVGWLVAGLLAGLGLILHTGLVPVDVDCWRSPHCYTVGHPDGWIGSLVILAAFVGAYVLASIGSNLGDGRSAADGPRG